MKKIVQCLLLIFICAVMATGCMFYKLRDDLEKLDSVSHNFSGTISANGIEAHTIVLVGLRDRQGENIAGYRVMSRPGSFEFVSDPTPTYFFAFEDLNVDMTFQASEPHGWAAAGQPLDPSLGVTDQIQIEIAATGGAQPAFPPQLVNVWLGNQVDDGVQYKIGTEVSLDNPWFSEERAKNGLWEPFAFIEAGGAGIHFLQPYDPEKIPVLFVHGINGTPRNFTALIENLDRSRYQAWVFSYPSGLKLSQTAYGMYQFIEILNRRHHFDQLHVIAHSMGGLVSRGGINLCRENDTCKYLRSYTTLSTPWNGVASAQSGVELAPVVVPVWEDMGPQSEYVTTLFDTPLPDELPYFLFFGFRQDSIFGSESSDGVIKLTSQLRQEAQDQATMMRGYDEDHVSILGNESVLGTVYGILDLNSQ